MTMPRNKDLKRLVRARMEKTGEAYTAARAQIVRKARGAKRARKTAAPAAAPPKSADYAKVAGMSDAAIEKNSGRTWAQWVELLDRVGAIDMAHRDIAAMVHEKYGVPGWWTQTVTVGYERIKGLRARGQRRDGSYEANKSRTYDVPVARLFEAWADAKVRRRWLIDPDAKVRTASAPKSMRLGMSDGTIVAVWFTAKGTKSSVGVQHTKLPDRETADRLKTYWAERLDALEDVLGE
jgi:hypothetical protein